MLGISVNTGYWLAIMPIRASDRFDDAAGIPGATCTACNQFILAHQVTIEVGVGVDDEGTARIVSRTLIKNTEAPL